MGIPLFANNANTILASNITNSQTTIPLNTGTGALFTSPAGGDYFMGTLISASNPNFFEVVQVTARAGDSLTVVRAQEGTTGKAFSASDVFAQLVTARDLNDLRLLASLPTSTGSANAQAVANSAGATLQALTKGAYQEVIPGFTNTGSMTLAVDATAATTAKAFGQNLQAGMVVQGVIARYQYDGTNWILRNPQVPYSQLPTSTGSANAQAVANTVNPIKALVAGITQAFKAGFTNTAAATLNPDGLGATTLQAWGQALIGGEIVAGNTVETEYDGTNLQVLNPLITALGLTNNALEATVFNNNGTFTPLTTGKYIVVGIAGGGGGGGGGNGTVGNGGGGGCGGSGGEIGINIFNLTAGVGAAVVIGTGGGGGIHNADGSQGNNTTFNGVTVATGGQGGRGGNTSVSAAAVGFPGTNGGGYGGGIGSLSQVSVDNGGNGVANTGGGGGGAGGGNGANNGGTGGNGGKGVLWVIRA